MKKIFGAFRDRQGRKGLIAFMYNFLVWFLAVIFVILPAIGAVVVSVLVIAGELRPIALVVWPAIIGCVFIYFLIFSLLTIQFGFFFDNVEIAQEYIENKEKEVEDIKEEEPKQLESKKCILLCAYKLPGPNGAIIPANTEVEYLGEENGKAKIGYVANGNKHNLLVQLKDIKINK